MKRVLYLVFLSMVALLVFAPAASAQEEMTVSIQDFFFDPGQLTVAPGTTVTWVNDGQMPHDVTSTDGKDLASATLQPGESYSYTFEEADAGQMFAYQCTIHPEMTASVTVSGGDEATPPADEDAMSPTATASAKPMKKPTEKATASATATATASPTATATAPKKELPETGGPLVPVVAAGALLGLGALAVISMRRRAS